MQNIFIDILPPWVETGLQPAFYDLESGTVLQQTARMYAKVRELTEAFNTFTENVTNEITTFEQNTNDEIERFEGDINDTVEEYINKFNELHDYVEDYFDNLDVQDEINNKLDEMVEDGTLQTIVGQYLDQFIEETNEKLDTLPVNDESKTILYTFYDIDDSNKINFFTSEDGINIRKLSVNSPIYGGDPSVIYKNGKFYLAYTNASTTYDFSVKVSEDLNTWEQHDIDVGLYDATYDKRWAPEWFEDDDGKLYIIISKQYANTEGWGDFRQYIAECTDLETLTFSTARRMYLSDSPSDNHIDSAVVKYNNIYHMIVKSEHQTELYLEYFTSNNLIDWTFQSADPMNFGRGVEAPDIFKLGDEFYIVADKYRNRPLLKSYQYICKTKDFQTYSPVDYISYPDTSLNHCGACIVDKKLINKLLTDGNTYIEDASEGLASINCIKNFHVAANQLTDTDTNAGQRLGNYLHLFDVSGSSQWRTNHIQFRIASGAGRTVDASYGLQITTEGSGVTAVNFNEIECMNGYINTPRSLAGKMIAVKDSSNGTIVHVYVDLSTAQFSNNEPVVIEFIGQQMWFAKITKFTDKFADSIDTTSGIFAWANGSPNSRSAFVDSTTGKARFKFACRNASLDVYGNINGSTGDRILNGRMLINGGYVAYKNFNPDLAQVGQSIAVTVESYDATRSLYTILVTGLPNPTQFGISLPPSDRSYIMSANAVNP